MVFLRCRSCLVSTCLRWPLFDAEGLPSRVKHRESCRITGNEKAVHLCRIRQDRWTFIHARNERVRCHALDDKIDNTLDLALDLAKAPFNPGALDTRLLLEPLALGIVGISSRSISFCMDSAPDPASARCIRMPLVSTKRCAMLIGTPAVRSDPLVLALRRDHFQVADHVTAAPIRQWT